VTTDSSGNVVSRRDFRPYGEEIYRPTQGTDKVRQKFTSYERDIETNLDYAKARMFGSGLGRFTSPDAPFADQIEDDGQSWNLYEYGRNNPLMYTDPTGFWIQVECISEGGGRCYMAEEGDTYESLAEILNLSPKNIGDFFQNQDIAEGMVFDVSGYDDWVRLVDKRDSTYRGLDDLLNDRYMRFDPPAGGGIKNITKAASKGGIFSKLWRGVRKLFGYADEASSSAKSVAQYMKLKQLYRSLMSKPQISDPTLRTWLDDFWRNTATHGNGSPMAAVAEEMATGQPVGNVFHTQKVKDGLVYLERWLKNNPSASANDRHAVEQIIQSIKDVIQ
jgi:RHS repeat-associated protein